MHFISFIILAILSAAFNQTDVLNSGIIFGGSIVYAMESVRRDSEYGVLAPIVSLISWRVLADPTVTDMAEIALVLISSLVISYKLMAEPLYARGFVVAITAYFVSLFSRSRVFSDGVLVGAILFLASVEIFNRRFILIAYVSELIRKRVRRLREWRK